MSIRHRLTLWLGGMLIVALAVMSGVLYQEFVERQQDVHEENSGPESPLQEAAEIALLYGLPTVCILVLGIWWILGELLAPIAFLTGAAGRLQADKLKERLPRTGRGDELDALTEVFNSMTARLDESITLIREFTLNASHELKTPLTILRAQMESKLRGGGTTATENDELGSQLDEIARLTRIVDALTLLSKADSGQWVLSLSPVRLDELVRASVSEAQILGSPHRLQVELTVCDEITFAGDRHRLKQLLLNLADNATKYAQPGGQVTIALRRDQSVAEVTMTNTGPGIPSEILPRVFDRFYRGDSSHNNAIEGCGLGLSIAQWIARAHGGTLQIESTPGLLTTAKIRLPIGTGNGVQHSGLKSGI